MEEIPETNKTGFKLSGVITVLIVLALFWFSLAAFLRADEEPNKSFVERFFRSATLQPTGDIEVSVAGTTSYTLEELKGERGPEGPEGPQGPQGEPGKDGASSTGGSLTLGDLLDVLTTGAVSGDVLKFDGSKWVKGSDKVNDADSSKTNEIQGVQTNQGLQVNSGDNFGLIACLDGQVLKNSGGATWVCGSDDTGAGGSVTGTGSGNRVTYWSGTSTLTSSANLLFDGNDLNVATGTLFVDQSTGRVGVGTTTPATTLDVNGTATATLFSGSGASLTSLNATNISTGTIADARLSANVSLLGGSIQDGEVDNDLTISAAGSVADGALSANVALLTGTQTFSGAKTFSSAFTLSALTNCDSIDTNGSGVLSCGTDNDTTYTAGTDLDLSGTTFSVESQLDGVSTISRASSNLTLQTTTSGNILINPAGDLNVDSNSLYVDSSADSVGIGTASINEKLTVNGNGEFLQNMYVRGVLGSTTEQLRVHNNNVDSYIDFDGGHFNVRDNSSVRFYIQDATGLTGIGTNSVNEQLTIQGRVSLAETTSPTDNAGYGKLFVKSSDSLLYFRDDGGTEYNLTSGGGVDTSGTPLANQLAFFSDADTIQGSTKFAIDDTAGQLYTNAGSATNPGYSFVGDTNTGIYSAGADILDLTTAGSVRVALNTTALIASVNVVPSAAGTYNLGSTTQEFQSIFVADDTGINFGLGQDALLAYDEAVDNRVELTGSGASLYIEDRLALGAQVYNVASNGNPLTAATGTLIPTASYVEATCNDAQDCDITMGETSATSGDIVTIVNISANTFNFADTSGVSELAGTFAMGQYDTLTLIYANARWVELSRSNN